MACVLVPSAAQQVRLSGPQFPVLSGRELREQVSVVLTFSSKPAGIPALQAGWVCWVPGRAHWWRVPSLTLSVPLPLQALYMFYALAIVCDDFFVPSLEKICEVRGGLGAQDGAGGIEDMRRTGSTLAGKTVRPVTPCRHGEASL